MPPDAIGEGLDLAERLLARERAAVPDALNLVDDRRPQKRAEALALLDQLERAGGPGHAERVGITGAPGAGKSTLLDALVRAIRPREETIGIVAVDPSSQLSGGALLGDRFRLRSGARDPGVFLRSMAARDRLGGLADATHGSVAILATVFDRVFVETVGVGQSESEVAGLVDTLIFVAHPSAGDTLQFMKAGILELPDVFAVNKSDLGGPAERTAAELRSGLGLADAPRDGWQPPVVLCSALTGAGIEELLDAIERHRSYLLDGGRLEARRREGRVAAVLSALERRYGSFGIERSGGRRSLVARTLRHAGSSPLAISGTLGREIEAALRKPE